MRCSLAGSGGPVWDVEFGGTVCVLVADCQRPQSRARLKPETMTVTFEEFSPTHDFFDHTSYGKLAGEKVGKVRTVVKMNVGSFLLQLLHDISSPALR